MADSASDKSLVARIYSWHEENSDDGLRPHLGASQIGHPCLRYLWLTFRWAQRPKWPGRMLRLFSRGQREESVIVAELRGLGAEVLAPEGRNWRTYACGGHLGGEVDGVVRGMPGSGSPDWEILEFKTHNDKSFKELVKKGVLTAKPMHFYQMQTYLYLTGLSTAHYIAVNKNDDELYHETIKADNEIGRELIEKANRVIFALDPPVKINADPEWWQCKMCNFHNFCHGKSAPIVNCRTCTHSTPVDNGIWQCERYQTNLTIEQQKNGCLDHRYVPILLDNFAELIEGDEGKNSATYQDRETGVIFENGQLSSDEIYQQRSAS